MIKAEELRIGNIIENGFRKMNGFPDYHDKVTALNAFGEVNVFSCPIDRDYAGTKNMMPNEIPLTEEWLVKFGFENVDTNENGGDNYWYLSDMDFILDRSFQSLNMNTGIDLKYVHQLQNLCFALTGQELTIKKD